MAYSKRWVSRRCARYFICLPRQVTESSSFNLSIAEHDIYSAYLLLCQPEGTFIGEVTAGFVNLDPEGGLTQHLPIELTMLPGIYSVSYLGMTRGMVSSAYTVRARKLICDRRGFLNLSIRHIGPHATCALHGVKTSERDAVSVLLF